METVEENADDENYFSIEIDEELFMSVPAAVAKSQTKEGVHPLIQREFEHGKGSYFFCPTCDKSYLNIEDFIESHPMNAKAEEEAINELIEYDGDSEPENTAKDLKNDTIKTEFDDDVETSAEKYFCYDCRTCFKELSEAEQHECLVDNQVENQNVDACKTSVPDVESIVEFMCAFCEINFENLARLEQHQKICPNYNKKSVTSAVVNEQYVCSICCKTFATAKALNTHSRNHKHMEQEVTDRETTCHICNIAFSTNKRLKLHMRIHDVQPVRSIQQALPEIAQKEYNRLDHFYCEICNKSFDQKLLGVHKSMHQEVKKTCEICNRHFDDAQSYEVHQQMHKSQGDIIGDRVIRTGPTEAKLRNDKNGIKSIHVENAKQTYPCQYCGHIFWRPFEKTRHERVHTGEKPYKCEICGKQFRVPYSLTLHLRTHTDLRPFVCSTCNKRFKSQSVYSHHLLTHLNQRSYYCGLCDKTFRTSVQLNAHKKSHTKPFNCIVCNRPFASLHAVKLHMKNSHEKARNNVSTSSQLSCELCGAVYARTVFLRAHLRDHHGVEAAALTSDHELYAESAVEESVDESEAALLITAAADAEARDEQRHRLKSSNKNLADDLAVDAEYLSNELILDSFEETVETGF